MSRVLDLVFELGLARDLGLRWLLNKTILLVHRALILSIALITVGICVLDRPQRLKRILDEIEHPTPPPEVIEVKEDAIIQCIKEAAGRYGIPLSLFESLLRTETANLDTFAVSEAGAIGIGQIMPSNAAFCGLSKRELFHPCKNIDCAGRLLSSYKKEQGNWYAAVGFYNGGKYGLDKNQCKPNSYIDKEGKRITSSYTCTYNKETHEYIRKVLGGIR